jgi:hypothetical protein
VDNFGRRIKTIEEAFNGGKANREWLIQQLADLVNFAKEKILDRYTETGARLGWARILVSASQACGQLLQNADLDVVKLEILELRRQISEVTGENEQIAT